MNSDADEIREEYAKALLKLASPEIFGNMKLNHIGHAFYNLYLSGLEKAEKEERLIHQLYDPEKEWEDNRNHIVEEMKKNHFPSRETITTHADRVLLNEAWIDFFDHLQRENKVQELMAKTALQNFMNHEFFWHRLQGRWLYFLPKERMKILTELTRFKWNEHIPSEVISIIESAQLMLAFDFKLGREPEKHKITQEESEYIVSFAFSVADLGKILFGMYRNDATLHAA